MSLAEPIHRERPYHGAGGLLAGVTLGLFYADGSDATGFSGRQAILPTGGPSSTLIA
jgi:hypothetical protein